MALVICSVATIIDAFGVSLSFAFLVGGRKVSDLIGFRAEIFGGLVLVFIGLCIVLTHIFVWTA